MTPQKFFGFILGPNKAPKNFKATPKFVQTCHSYSAQSVKKLYFRLFFSKIACSRFT